MTFAFLQFVKEEQSKKKVTEKETSKQNSGRLPLPIYDANGN